MAVFLCNGFAVVCQFVNQRIFLCGGKIRKRAHLIRAVGNGDQINLIRVRDLYLRVVFGSVLFVIHSFAAYFFLCSALSDYIGQRGIAAVFQFAVLIIRIVGNKSNVFAIVRHDFFILHILFVSVIVICHNGNIVKRKRQIHFCIRIGSGNLRDRNIIGSGGKGAARPSTVFIRVSYAGFRRFVIRVAHIVALALRFLRDPQFPAGMIIVNVVITGIIHYILAVYDMLLYRFQFIRSDRAGACILVRHDKMNVLVDQCVAVRRAARDHALPAVAAHHALAPAVGLVFFRFGKFFVSCAVGDFVFLIKDLAHVRRFRRAGGKGNRNAACQQQADAFFYCFKIHKYHRKNYSILLQCKMRHLS